MTAAPATVPRQRLVTLESAVATALAAAAWVGTFAIARGMTAMSGTMGMRVLEFVPAWTLMMAAMMLPAVGVTASVYARTIVSGRCVRLVALGTGYLGVWALAGLPAFGLAKLGGELTSRSPGAAHVLAVALFAAAGVYQLSPLKSRCLARCRSPLALLLHYRSYQGRLRDIRVGVHHGAYCLACCWTLMLLLVAVGVMNLVAMACLTVLIAAEKLWAKGVLMSHLAGVAALGMAIAVIFLPSLAPGLHSSQMMMGS